VPLRHALLGTLSDGGPLRLVCSTAIENIRVAEGFQGRFCAPCSPTTPSVENNGRGLILWQKPERHFRACVIVPHDSLRRAGLLFDLFRSAQIDKDTALKGRANLLR